MKCFIFFCIFVIFFLKQLPCQNYWLKSSGPEGGSIQSLAYAIDGSIYACTWGGGVFRSTDNGRTWSVTNIGTQASIITYVACDSNNNIFATNQDTVFRSTDFGKTWINFNRYFRDGGINSLISISRNYLVALFAGTFYFSMDGGETFSGNTVLREYGYQKMVKDKKNNLFVIGDAIGKSTDLGFHWQMKIDSINGSYQSSILMLSNGYIIAAKYSESLQSPYLIRSTDEGETWVTVNNSTPFPTLHRIEKLTELPSGSLLVFLHTATNGAIIFRSDNSGETWYQFDASFPSPVFITDFLSISDSSIFASSDVGVLRSTDDGSSWHGTNRGLTATKIYSIDSNPQIICSGSDAGFHISTDHGFTWTKSPIIKYTATGAGIDQRNNIYVSTYDWQTYDTTTGVFFSSDMGHTWTKKMNGLGHNYVKQFICRDSGIVVALTARGIYRSSDYGDLWSPTNVGLYSSSNCIKLVTNSLGYYYLATDDGVFKSSDSGNNWINIASNLPRSQVTTIAIGKNNELYTSPIFKGIYVSTDDGTSWTSMNNGLSNYRIEDIAVDSSGTVFACAMDAWEDAGNIFRFSFSKKTWESVASGLYTRFITKLHLGKDGFIYAGTYGAGIFRSVKALTEVHGYELSNHPQFKIRVTPNPVSTEAQIRFNVAQSELVKISILNALGREIIALKEEALEQREHNVSISVNRLVNGVYFCVLQTKKSRSIQPFVIMH